MDDEKLRSEILYLIELQIEGPYWDFKEKWINKKADLLHDIICMSNNLENRDAYIIIGVRDSKAQEGFAVVGVKVNSEERKDQQQLITFLRDKKFAGGVRPVVILKTLQYKENVFIDVIIIKNTSKTPYYLSEKFESLFANNIYSRIGDTNTPKDKSADIDKIEYLWKKRLGIDQTVIERLLIILDDNENWEYEDELPHYHKVFPEFHIEYTPDEFELLDGVWENDMSHERYCGFYIDKKASYYSYKILYHSTILYKSQYLLLDGTRVKISNPKTNTFQIGENYLWYYSFNKDDLDGKMLSLFNKGRWQTTNDDSSGEGAFLIFDNDEEKLEFEKYVYNNFSVYKALELDKILRARSAIEYESELKWDIKCCESMARLSIMYKNFKSNSTKNEFNID